MIDAMGKHGEEKEAKDEDMQEVEPSDNMKKGNEEMTNDTGRLREEKEGKDKDMQEVETLKEDKEREDLQ